MAKDQVTHFSGVEVRVCFWVLGYTGQGSKLSQARTPPLLSTWNLMRPVASAPGAIWGGVLAIWDPHTVTPAFLSPLLAFLSPLILGGFSQNDPHLTGGETQPEVLHGGAGL